MDELYPVAANAEPDDESSPLTPDRQACPELGRRDGWTPFARKLFLQVLAETGRVKLACEYCRLSTQSAYALRHRDPVFAAGWDAACELARAPLADALYERAMEGYEESISRHGEVVATRHRFDSRLSIAVLHRLDKRCDQARAKRARHLRLLARWEEWLDLVGKGDEDQARALLENGSGENASERGAQPCWGHGEHHSQLHQLTLGGFPTPLERESCGFWQDDVGSWQTDYPPPEDFDGFEKGSWGDWDYERSCTEEEEELLEHIETVERTERLAQAAADRDAYLADLKAKLVGGEEPPLENGVEPD